MKKFLILSVLSVIVFSISFQSVFSQETGKDVANQNSNPYLCEDDWIEVMFVENSSVRLRNGSLIDYATDALNGVDQTLDQLEWFTWYRICDVPEDIIDQWSVNGERNTGKPVYNMNNIYRLQIPKGYNIWELSKSLENLSGIMLARPVPKPMELPLPGNYQPQQGYLNPASSSPTGIDALYAWTQTGGTGTGVTVCDLEYSWNYSHADISKAAGSQINTLVQDPFSDNNHGTAVIGELVADNNSWGTTGICYGSGLKTCGTYYGSPVAWNVPGAMAVAIASLSAGDIILLEQQWDYTGSAGYVPIEWWLNYSPNAQTNNGVYAAIVNAISNGIHVVEAGGNGYINTDGMTWYGNSGAIIVGAGGASISNDLQKLNFSSYGSRFDLQGWGENVVTTGYGDLYSTQGVNYYYTSTFSGTSSASPIVAGALACAEGYYLANVSATPPTPSYMRSHLKTYGTAQVTPPTGNIGPRPDLYATIQNFPPPQNNYDFGDAPDPSYPTLLASNGARHIIAGGVFLGALIDAELDGQPHPNALGDDNNNLADEDGVVFTSPIIPGQNAMVDVTASVPGILNAWIDFDINGWWGDPGEQIFTDLMLTAGLNNLTFPVPASALPGISFARFRFSNQAGLNFDGAAPDGEVEDYEVFIEEGQPDELDWGDAPDFPYPTLAINNGANHKLDGMTYMGNMVDAEPDGLPDPQALGDDNNNFADEDGVMFTSPIIQGQNAMVDVTASVPGILNAWIDFDGNGFWGDPGEQIFTDLMLTAGLNNLTFSVPSTALPGISFARFRFSNQAGLNFDGAAPDGEVEDYEVFTEEGPIDELDWGDAPDPNYPTLAANNGANHWIDGITFMGGMVDGEPDGQPDAQAQGDDQDIFYPPPNDDEDGVVFTSTIIQGQNATVDVVASVPGILNAWFDFDANGSWADPGEHVFVDVSLNPGLNNLTYNVPASAAQGNTFARFRFSTIGGLNFDGPASDGEVEDYQIYIGIQTSDIPIDPDPTGSFVQNEISMALVPGTQPGIPAVLLAAYNDDPYPGGPGLGVSYSTDGGATWIPQQLPYPPDPYSGGFFVDMFDPTATADANGDLYVAQISTDYNWTTGPASGLFVHKSTDGGVTWLPPVAIATDGAPVSNPDLNYRFNDRCQIIADIDPASTYYNNLYIVWIKDRGWNVGSPLSDIYFSSSTDGGATWSTNVTINQTIHNMGNMPNPTVASDGTIYVCWMDYNVQTGGTGTIYLNISTDGGVTWLPTDIFVTTVNLPPLRLNGGTDVLAKGAAVIEVSPFNPQELYIVYAEASAAGGDEGDIFFIKSTDGGQNWSALLRVNDDATFNDQVMPWMDVKPNGTIDVTWYDRRNDPLDLDWDVYIAMSTDGGNSFTPNMQVNNLPAPSPNTPSGYWMGEYLGLVVDNTHAYIGFTSSIADINGDVFFAKTQNPLAEIDFGDAPDPTYPTLIANNGARHNIDGVTFLGALIDAEPDGLQDPNALGDDNNNLADEDGIVFSHIIQGSPAQITVTTSTAGYLQGWMDFNADGDWTDPGEQIFTDAYIHFGYTVCLNYLVPVNANIGTTYARFRFSTVGGLSYTGLATDGEVEDYEVEITQDPDIKWLQEPCVQLPGLHCTDDVEIIADDWECHGGLVTDIHWWGNYENNLIGSGINYFHLSIHDNDPTGTCLPLDPEIWGKNVPLASVNETNTGLINSLGDFIYKYDYVLEIPFEQIEGNFYWLDICAYSFNGDLVWRWQESARSNVPILCPAAHFVPPWQSIVWNTPPPTRYSDMAFVITSEEIELIDFGDASDPTYPTLLANNGARHNIDGVTYLGALIDEEPNGLQDPNALGDDNNNLDDEDGVSVTFPLYVGGTGGFSIVASVDGILNAWIDFDGNGSWAEANEHIFLDYSLSAGNNLLLFPVPANANVGTTYARFRFSSVGGLTYTGLAPDGEVEDHKIIIEGDLDFGDAKDPSYPTFMANDGARHLVNTLVYLGACIDAEPDGLPDPNALGDDNNNLDDEDGVILPSIIVYNQMNTVKVIASVNGYLNAWIDFNQNGNWGDAGEQIFTDQAVNAGNNVLIFNVPASAYFGTTFARFRFNTAGGLTYTGQADDGEVEDYEVAIREVYKWLQEPDLSDMGMDVDATYDFGGFYPPMILADDFLCDITGPLTRIEIWGSWYHDIKPEGDPGAVTFTLSIHKDIPAEQSPTGYSMPGEVLWIGIFNPNEFMFEPYAMGLMEGWYNPALSLYEPFGDTECWRYIFDLMQAEPFIQEGTPDEPIVYWLDVQAQPLDDNPECRFGWKTSVNHWNDDAVWTIGMEPYIGDWVELRYPEGHPWYPESIDLAFAIYGQEDPFILVDLTAFLEGPYNGSDMNTNLNAAGLIPFNQPYYSDPSAKWYYTGTESVSMIPNTDITDWVLVELRDAPTANLATGATMVDQRAAFVLKDASIVATDGSSLIKFYTMFVNNPFVVVWHRNHLGVLSANPMNLVGLGLYSYDFTTPAGQAYLNGQKNLGGTIYGLFGGDGKPDELIDANDKTVWTLQAGTTGYLESDYNMDTQVDNKDKNDVWVPNIGQGTQVP